MTDRLIDVCLAIVTVLFTALVCATILAEIVWIWRRVT